MFSKTILCLVSLISSLLGRRSDADLAAPAPFGAPATNNAVAFEVSAVQQVFENLCASSGCKCYSGIGNEYEIECTTFCGDYLGSQCLMKHTMSLPDSNNEHFSYSYSYEYDGSKGMNEFLLSSDSCIVSVGRIRCSSCSIEVNCTNRRVRLDCMDVDGVVTLLEECSMNSLKQDKVVLSLSLLHFLFSKRSHYPINSSTAAAGTALQDTLHAPVKATDLLERRLDDAENVNVCEVLVGELFGPTVCDCDQTSTRWFDVNCTDICSVCNDDNSACTTLVGYFTRYTKAGSMSRLSYTYENSGNASSKGTFSFEETYNGCAAFVNGTRCNSCSFTNKCIEGAVIIDCTNIDDVVIVLDECNTTAVNLLLSSTSPFFGYLSLKPKACRSTPETTFPSSSVATMFPTISPTQSQLPSFLASSFPSVSSSSTPSMGPTAMPSTSPSLAPTSEPPEPTVSPTAFSSINEEPVGGTFTPTGLASGMIDFPNGGTPTAVSAGMLVVTDVVLVIAVLALVTLADLETLYTQTT